MDAKRDVDLPEGQAENRPGLRRLGHRIHAATWRTGRWLGLHRIAPTHVLLAAAAALVLASVTWERCGVAGCPDVDRLVAYQPDGAPVLMDREGRPFGTLAPFRREVIPLDSLPAYVGEAFVAVEDRRFRSHAGIDWVRVVGAAVANVRSWSLSEGSSTITMQLARNIFPEQVPGTERTFRRKLLEARLAREIEARFTKHEILELYLNHIYFGGGAYGIEAASRYWFDRSARELTLSQAALLAALPKAPAHYDPRRRAERAKSRRDLVLGRMAAQGRIEPAAADSARSAPLAVADEPPFRGSTPGLAPYFVDAVRRQLEDRFGEKLYTSRLVIRTTLDVDAQRAAEEELVRQLRAIEEGRYGRFNGPRFGASPGEGGENGSLHLEGAAVFLDVATGDVIALVGGRDYRASRFDRAVYGNRQLGSAFKPFVYATALAAGVTPSTLLADAPLRVALDGGRVWEPRNYDGEYGGAMSMREALVESRNVPAVRVASAVGEAEVARTARAARLHDVPEHPSMALGTVAVSPTEVASAYSAFAGLGRGVVPRFVRRVEGADGATLWSTDVESFDAVEPGVAYIVTDMLRDAVNRGTGRAVRQVGFHAAAAGKTGTTSDGHDAWFVGYTPDVVGTVWIGFDSPRPILRNATGGGLAAPVWGRIARRFYAERRAPLEWAAPENVVRHPIDPESGRILGEGCRPRYDEAADELFLAGMEGEAVCPRRGFRPGDWIAGILDAIGLRDDDARRRDGGRSGRMDSETIESAVRELERLLSRRGRRSIEVDEAAIEDAARQLERLLSRRARIESERRERDEQWLRDRARQRSRDRDRPRGG